MLKTICLINFIRTWINLRKDCVFADSLLIVSYVQDALRKELLMIPFIECFETITFGKSLQYLEQFAKALHFC